MLTTVMMMRLQHQINQGGQTELLKEQAGWSGLQVNLVNHINQQYMREIITLDNGSTLSLFCNPELLENIRESKTILKMHTNAGSKLSNQQAAAPEFGTVWFQKDAIANIFEFRDLVDQYWTTYDSLTEFQP